MITTRYLLVKIKVQFLFVMLVVLLGEAALPTPGMATVMCDLKGTGNVTAVDALMVLQMAVGLDAVTPAATACCNSYGDAQITAECAIITLREAVGLPVNVPTLVSIAVTPATPSIAVGATQQFTATGTFSSNSTQNLTTSVTWSSSNTSVATITASGIATSVAAGSTTITSTYGTIAGTTTLTVTQNSATWKWAPVSETIRRGE